MNCAVSVIVRPSPCLYWLCAAFGGALIATALVIGLGTPERFALGGLVALVPLAGAAALGWPLVRARHRLQACSQADSHALLPKFGTAHRLDISGLGQLRLTVQQEMRAAGALHVAGSSGPTSEGVAVTLLPGATVWPGCILLLLRTAAGKTVALVVLRDSLSPGDFRALSVAVRSLAQGARDAATKIL
jgi:toxin CptA